MQDLCRSCYYLSIQAITALAETTAIADFRDLTVFPLHTSFTVVGIEFPFRSQSDVLYDRGGVTVDA